MTNLYYEFIEILKQKELKGFQPNSSVHKHHIEPKHSGGDPNGEIVLCTPRYHARAHYIRYKVYNQFYDYCAYCGLVGRTNEMEALIQLKIIQTNRERGNCMFNNDWQREMANRPKSSYYLQENPDFAKEIARKGGQIGGKVMTDKKRIVLQQNGFYVGTNFGKLGGLKHQNHETKRRLSLHLEWEHDSGIFVISPPLESVTQLKEYLNLAVPNSVKHCSGLSELLRQISKKRYGWKILKELNF